MTMIRPWTFQFSNHATICLRRFSQPKIDSVLECYFFWLKIYTNKIIYWRHISFSVKTTFGCTIQKVSFWPLKEKIYFLLLVDTFIQKKKKYSICSDTVVDKFYRILTLRRALLPFTFVRKILVRLSDCTKQNHSRVHVPWKR